MGDTNSTKFDRSPLTWLAGDFEKCWRAGRRLPVEVFLNEHPDLSADADAILDLIHAEVVLREGLGESPQLDEYQGRFPHLADAVRELFALHMRQVSEDAATLRFAESPESGARRWPTLPGYELLGELGRGGMGVVFKARQRTLNRIVALKWIRAGIAAEPEALARFKTEAEAVARLQHPNIVQVYEVGTHDGQPYCTFEYADGGSLYSRIKGVPQPSDEAARTLAILARAVQAAHERGVVHRDLKPANVLLAADGTLKIADFGLAKLLAAETAGQTQSGAILGTPSYMAPEQAAGRVKEVGPLTDTYALGAILYEMLTGRPPFRGETPTDTLVQVISGEPVPPSRLNRKVPRDLETICLKCLERDVTRRYGSAAVLADDLERFLAREPIQARPLGWAGRWWRWCRRKPGLAAALGSAALAVLAALILAGTLAVVQTRAVVDLQIEKQKTEDEQAKTVQALRASQVQSATLALEQGLMLCERGEEDRGMFWLARALELTPADEDDLRHAILANLGAWRHRLPTLQAVLPHGDQVQGVALSPDGRRALTVGLDKMGRLWDPADGRLVAELAGHEDGLQLALFSPDGATLVTGAYDGIVRLRDSSGRPKGNPLKHIDYCRAAAFAADGRLLTVCLDGYVRRWDAATGQLLDQSVYHGGIWDGVLSSDGKTFATIGAGSAVLWDATSLAKVRTFAHAGTLRALALSRDGKLLVTGGSDRFARLWNTSSGQMIGVPLPHQHTVYTAAISPDGKTVLTGCEDGAGRLWDAATGLPLGSPLEHRGIIMSAAFSGDGCTALTASGDGTVRLWDARTGRPRGAPLRHQGNIEVMALGADGSQLLTGSGDGTARVWDTTVGSLERHTFRGSEKVSALAYSPDSRRVAISYFNNSPGPQVYDVESGRVVARLAVSNRIWTLAFSPDGKRVATAGNDSCVTLWDAETGALVGKPMAHRGPVEAIAFRPDGRALLSANTVEGDRSNPPVRGEAHLWDLDEGRAVGEAVLFTGSIYDIYPIAFSLDGSRAAVGDTDGTVRVLDGATGQPVHPPLSPRHRAVVSAIVFTPDSKRLLTASHDRKARLWDVASGAMLAEMIHQAPVETVAFTRDGRLILTGSREQAASLWDGVTGQPVGRLPDDHGGVYPVAFSPDDRLAVTGSEGGAVRLWDVRTRRPVGPPLWHVQGVYRAAFAPDGRTVLAGDNEGIGRLWMVPVPLPDEPDRLRIWLEAMTGQELDRSTGAIRALSVSEWQERRRRLADLGGPP